MLEPKANVLPMSYADPYDSNNFVRMLQGLVEGLIGVSMSMIRLSLRLGFFFFAVCPPGMSLIQMTMFLDKSKLFKSC